MRHLRLHRPARHDGVRASGRRRLILVVLTAAAAFAALAPAAAGNPPERVTGTVSGSTVMTDVCSFPVTVDFAGVFSELRFYDQSGALTRIEGHQTEQDTFSANGISITGLPYNFNYQFLFDSNGDLTHLYATGLVERIVLPNGTLFLSAGRVDFVDHPNETFLLTPDRGRSGNLEAFCAALS